MHVWLLVCYLAINLILALSMHFATLRTTLERPRKTEFLVYFIAFLIAGVPMFLCATAVGFFRKDPESDISASSVETDAEHTNSNRTTNTARASQPVILLSRGAGKSGSPPKGVG